MHNDLLRWDIKTLVFMRIKDGSFWVTPFWSMFFGHIMGVWRKVRNRFFYRSITNTDNTSFLTEQHIHVVPPLICIDIHRALWRLKCTELKVWPWLIGGSWLDTIIRMSWESGAEVMWCRQWCAQVVRRTAEKDQGGGLLLSKPIYIFARPSFPQVPPIGGFLLFMPRALLQTWAKYSLVAGIPLLLRQDLWSPMKS